MAFMHIEDISKEYTGQGSDVSVQVLRNVDFVVQEGEFVALMGPSGSGKSTLLTVLGAMNRPTRGKSWIDGIDVYSLGDEQRADFRREYIGFVFQQHHLLPYLSALENVMLPLTTSRMATAEKRARAMQVLHQVGLADRAMRLPSQLSGGEQGRVAIARALVNEPPLLLADEPTGSLDSKTGQDIMRVFAELNAQGQTVFMVTHSPDSSALAHRVLHITDGRLALGYDGQLHQQGADSVPLNRETVLVPGLEEVADVKH